MPRKTEPLSPDVKQPLQERSRNSLNRILETVEKLLESKWFSEISINEIASESGCGVGTIYGRFKNKEVILRHLESRFLDRLEQRQQKFLESRDWKVVSLENRIRELLAHITETYRSERALLRELVGRNQTTPKGSSSKTKKRVTGVFARDIEFLLENYRGKRANAASKRVSFAMLTAINMLQNRIVFGQSSPIKWVASDNRLSAELSNMVVAYLDAADIRF